MRQCIADRFEIRNIDRDLLGQGSMGDVYRATDTHTGEAVAVKALDPRVVTRAPGILERFVREGEALRQLNHPNIVRMVAAVEDEGRHYLVMEYVAGGSLQDLLDTQGALPASQVLEIALELADALTRAHHLGIIHRDLKPANVLLAEDGTPRLTDFGIARMLESPRLTETGVLVGTPDFLSPEACSGQALDERTDIWAFGVLLFEMLSGETPFPGDSLTAKLTAILTQPVPDLEERCPDAPEALVDLVYRMLEKDRAQRIPSVRLVGAELEAILKGREVPTPLRLAPGESRFSTANPAVAAPPQPQVVHNLPAQLTSFVGREREKPEVVQLLETTRLLTLTGPPGTGKTRLGLQVAAEVLDQFPDGAFFVDLAPIRDPGLVPTTIAQVLGIGESGGQPLLDTLKTYLRQKHLFLLLDNFEQIVDAAPLVGELMSSSPGLKALVTSREALRVYGEQEYPVPPLALPDLDRAEPLRSLSQYEAVELFARRARAVRPDFELTEDNAPAVAEICVRLDGLPLAIELAAARSTMLSPEMMRQRLESRLGVLVAGPRDLPARQRTLRGTIDWSYNLLDPSEKTLFARLAVFQGGRTVEAAEAVCSQGLTIGTLEGLESLLNKNLLRRIEGTAEEPRFVMLEMIHEYARERLEVSGEALDLRQRHAEYFLALAERAEPQLRGARQQHWSAQLRAEQDNLRAALAWALAEGEAELELRLVGTLRDFWFFDGHSAEGLRWAERALGSGQNASPAARAGALNTAGLMCYDRAEHEQGKRYNREALALFRELGDDVSAAWALGFLGIQALASPAECKEGSRLLEESLVLFRKLDFKPGITQVLIGLGEVARLGGDHERAARAYEECRAIAREEGDTMSEAKALGNLGYVAEQKGEYARAADMLIGALKLLRELEAKRYICQGFAQFAGPVAALGYPQAAARLLGASEALLAAMGVGLQAGDRHDIGRYEAAVREQLGEATFDVAWAEGRAMSFEQAVSYALEVGQQIRAAPPPVPVRETEVPKQIAPELSQLEQDYRVRLKARYAEDAAYFIPLAGETTEVVSKRESTAPRSTRRRKRRAQSAYHEWLQKGQDIKRVKLETLREAVDRYPCIVLLGDPGSGKTTALENLAYQFADEPDRLPVPLRLSEFDSGMSLDEFILQGWGGSPEADYWGASELAAKLEYYLGAGRLFILFDALNEMPHEGYRERTLALRHFIDAWSAKGNRFLVTCRVLDYGEELSGLQRVEVQPLNDEQIKVFLQKELPETWQGLWQSLTENSDDQCHLLEMARNPYVLTIMIDVFDEDGRLGQNRAELMERFTQILMGWAKAKTAPNQWLDPDVQREALSVMAFEMQARSGFGTAVKTGYVKTVMPSAVQPDPNWPPQSTPPDQVLSLAAAASIIEMPVDRVTVRFYHQLLQEYFAAHQMLKRGVSDPAGFQKLSDFWKWPWQESEMPLWVRPKDNHEPLPPPPPTGWEETTILAAGLALENDDQLVRTLLQINPVLAGRCLVQGQAKVDPALRQAVLDQLLSTVANPEVALRVRVAAGNMVGYLGDPRTGEMVIIPAGEFIMGEGREQHELFLPSYRLGKYPLTNAEYEQFIRADGYSNEQWWTKAGWEQIGRRESEPRLWQDSRFNRPNQPVLGVSWYEAVAYCHWLSADSGQLYRLPTEAEWEKGARGVDGRTYPWGNEFEASRLNIRAGEQQVETSTPVGIYPTGVSHFGIFDCAGNAWEWCATRWPKPYPYDAEEDEWQADYLEGKRLRALRSGSWNFGQDVVRCGYRFRFGAHGWADRGGCRLVSPI